MQKFIRNPVQTWLKLVSLSDLSLCSVSLFGIFGLNSYCFESGFDVRGARIVLGLLNTFLSVTALRAAVSSAKWICAVYTVQFAFWDSDEISKVTPLKWDALNFIKSTSIIRGIFLSKAVESLPLKGMGWLVFRGWGPTKSLAIPKGPNWWSRRVSRDWSWQMAGGCSWCSYLKY